MTEQITAGGIYYRFNAFNPTKPTLVLIHGLSGSSSAWWPYEQSLGLTHNLVSFDLRGHGRSKKFAHYADYEMKNFAQDCLGVLAELKIKNCVLMSHSFGTLVILELLAINPALATDVIFLSPNFNANHGLWKTLLYPFAKLAGEIFNVLPFYPRPGYHVDFSKFKNIWDLKPGLLLADTLCTSPRVFLYGLLRIKETDYSRAWRKINVPTLIIHGQRDSIFPVANAKALTKEIAGSRLVVLPNADHLFVLSQAPETLKIIKKFLVKIPAMAVQP